MCLSLFLGSQSSLDAGKAGSIKVGGQTLEVGPTMVEVRKEKKKMSGRNYTPSVIEPSFGIGRIIYCMFEHCYYTREGEGNEARSVFKFTPVVAPVKATVFPLVQKEALNGVARQVGGWGRIKWGALQRTRLQEQLVCRSCCGEKGLTYLLRIAAPAQSRSDGLSSVHHHAGCPSIVDGTDDAHGAWLYFSMSGLGIACGHVTLFDKNGIECAVAV